MLSHPLDAITRATGGTIVFNEEERRKELFKIGFQTQQKSISDMVNKIISQEKSMIDQAKKEAVKEFAEKLKCYSFWLSNPNNKIIYTSKIDKLLKEYEE